MFVISCLNYSNFTLSQIVSNKTLVESLFCTDKKSWDRELVRDLFDRRDYYQILSLPLPGYC
nr:uncharacterized protein LOC109172940 [Ipomoea batatas]